MNNAFILKKLENLDHMIGEVYDHLLSDEVDQAFYSLGFLEAKISSLREMFDEKYFTSN